MTDETSGSGSIPPANGEEASLGGASEWSRVERSSFAPPSPPAAAPSSSLQPLPQPAFFDPLSAPSGPPVPSQPAAAAMPAGQPGYEQVYGAAPVPPPGMYASSPGSGYPPPGEPPPPGYGAAGGPGYPPPSTPPPAMGQGLSSNAAATIAYITFIPAVVFLVMAPYNRDRFVRFHAWQCIALTIVAVAVGIVFSALGWIGIHVFWIMIHSLIDLVLFILWLVASYQGKPGPMVQDSDHWRPGAEPCGTRCLGGRCPLPVLFA